MSPPTPNPALTPPLPATLPASPPHTLTLSPAHLYTIHTAALTAYPHECCGILLGLESPAGHRQVTSAHPVPNSANAQRTHRYALPPEALRDAERHARHTGQLVLGFFHSHPDTPARPSPTDLEHAWPFYSYLIASVAGRPDPALPFPPTTPPPPTVQDLTCWQLDESTSRFTQRPITIESPQSAQN